MDFEFLQNPLSKKWVVLAPRRAKRPDVAKGVEPVCPFCVGREGDEKEVYRVPKGTNVDLRPSGSSVPSDPSVSSDWLVRVLPNKFPFAPIHEVIILSPDHHKTFGQLPLSQVELILQTYRHRYNEHGHKGQVYIFHNSGEGAGESLPHPHSQLAVVPFEIKTDLPRLDPGASATVAPKAIILDGTKETKETKGPNASVSFDNSTIRTVQTPHFYLFCPRTSQWPDEVWIAPNKRGRLFGEITDDEINDLASIINRLVEILTLRHGNEFPFNFYIYPGGDWYVRLFPRTKRLGGFEIGTGIFVNTQNPQETIAFIKEHFENPDYEKIKKEHQADYDKMV